MAKCNTCGAEIKGKDIIKIKKKNYCSLECAGLCIVYKPKEEKNNDGRTAEENC